MIEGSFTVTFEFPYWVGIAERHDERGYSVAKYIYGQEPSDGIILRSIKYGYRSLKFSEPCASAPLKNHEMNYKRQQKEIRRLMEQNTVQPLVEQAQLAERERIAVERIKKEKMDHIAEEERKYKLRQEQKKEKKKGH